MKTWICGWTWVLASWAIAAPKAELLPVAMTLDGSEARHGVLAVRVEGGDPSGEAKVSRIWAENEAVAIVEDGVVIGRGDGTTRILAETDAGPASATVTVKNFAETPEWNFSNHVMPVLARNNCNMGACHGAIAGKGGFRLSLRGYNPAGDYYTITRELRGRRVELAAPGQSLILTKPTAATPHKGGRKIEPMSRDYQVLAGWLSQGAPGPSDQDAKLASLEVLPARSVLTVGSEQRLLVLARYSDGRTEDVTSWAKSTSADETVASVDERGRSMSSGRGKVR